MDFNKTRDLIITNNSELKEQLQELYIIDNYMSSQERYDKFLDEIYFLITRCYEHKECREYPIRFKFYIDDKETHMLEFRHFIVNAILWYPLTLLHGVSDVLIPDIILDCSNDIPYLTSYINTKIIHVLQDCAISTVDINNAISKTLYRLRMISCDFAAILNLNMSFNSFEEIYRSSSRAKEIMEVDFPPSMQPYEIEMELEKLTNEYISLIKKIPNNPVAVILSSKTGIKTAQLREFCIAMGLKPDLTGVTIPQSINSSTLISGLDTPVKLTIDASGARKSAIMASTVMGDAGYFSKLLTSLTLSLSISNEVSDCGSHHYLEITIKSDEMLSRYNRRFYYDPKVGHLKVLNYTKDKHLIGKKVLFRSPVTCKLEDEICHKCFGLTSLLNLDIAEGIGGFESEEISKIINQFILSAKHLLSTISEKIEFCKAFDDFFVIYCGEIYPKTLEDENALDDYSIYIDPSSIEKVEEMDNDSSSNNFISSSFIVINNSTGEAIDIYATQERDLYLTEESLAYINRNKGLIPFKDLNQESTLFTMTILNNELTKPLYELMALINTKSKNVEERQNYHVFSQKFTELLVDAGVGAMAVAGELITNRLIRQDPDDDFIRPNFARKELEDYQILTLLQALIKNKSILLGLTSQNIKAQILNRNISKRTASSYIDNLFKETYTFDK